MTNKEFAKTINSLEDELAKNLYSETVEVNSDNLMGLISEGIKMRQILFRLEQYIEGSRDV